MSCRTARARHAIHWAQHDQAEAAWEMARIQAALTEHATFGLRGAIAAWDDQPNHSDPRKTRAQIEADVRARLVRAQVRQAEAFRAIEAARRVLEVSEHRRAPPRGDQARPLPRRRPSTGSARADRATAPSPG